jgi:TIR domain
VTTVFISYAHDDEDHKKAVRALAAHLRADGVDATIDAYAAHPPEGWAKWMEKQFRSDYVVAVISDRYIRDYDQEVDNASGARFEGAMLSALLLQRGVSFERIAVVVFDRWGHVKLPPLLHGCQRYYVDRPHGYDDLRDFVSGRLKEKPTLGVPASSPNQSNDQIGKSTPFVRMCRNILPLMDENRRLFEAFGPNSGASDNGTGTKSVRFDLTLWYGKRDEIVQNNKKIAGLIRLNRSAIPDEHMQLFDRWLSHIDAFEMHIADAAVDYRDHQFPVEVADLVRSSVS